MRRYSLVLVIFFLCVLILSGCGKLERKGTAPANVPPNVYFADVPPESTYFSVNPRIYWYGTDIDGFITAYQYAVVVKDSLSDLGGIQSVREFLHGIPTDSASWVDNIALKSMVGAHIVAEPGGSSRNVMMYADMNPNIFTPQYLFVRAVDNSGEVSDSIIYRVFYRNNHRPQAVIENDSVFRASNHYCLDDTSATWKGITISWSGKDSLDYPNPRNQPNFQFKWELVGPFEFTPTALTVDTMAVVDSSLDSTFAAGKWIYSRWVADKLHVFKGLENYGDSGYGWYQLRVRTRDDAFVSTDTATTMNFRILKPKFRYADRNKKTILLVDATAYKGRDGGANDTIDVRPFYRETLDYLRQSGTCYEYAMWHDQFADIASISKSAPSEDVLSRYDLVMVINVGSNPAISNDNFGSYRDYLNVGGRVWFVGLNNFNLPGGRTIHGLEEVKSAAPYAYEIGTSYLGLDGVFVPSWTTQDSMTLEFVKAESFGLWNDLPLLQVDTEKCKLLKGYNPLIPARNFGIRGIPYVCFDAISNWDFAGRIPAERRIYSFVSYYGSISDMDNKPCAINYIGSTYRTAEFCFPLHLMKNDGNQPVYQVMKRVVEWFWEDLP
ncbi:MAG: hypothetical protein ABII96_11955 [Candidatus Zixiibacteriota bacterium]